MRNTVITKNDVKAITLKGIEGLAKIQEIMTTLRDNTPAQIGEHKVLKARDYKKDTITDLETGAVTPTGLPNSNVLYYELPDAAWVCFRPFRYRAKTEILLWCQSRQHGSSRCKSSRAWRSSYGYCRADVRLMVHMSANEYRAVCPVFP